MAEEPRDLIRIGGLMQCCRETIEALYPPGIPAMLAAEGQRLHCKYVDTANHRMIFRDGAWEWDDSGREAPS